MKYKIRKEIYYEDANEINIYYWVEPKNFILNFLWYYKARCFLTKEDALGYIKWLGSSKEGKAL